MDRFTQLIMWSLCGGLTIYVDCYIVVITVEDYETTLYVNLVLYLLYGLFAILLLVGVCKVGMQYKQESLLPSQC